MKNLLTLTAILLMILVLSGCPYSATIPLGEPETKGSDFLIGYWEMPDNQGVSLNVKRGQNNELEVEKVTVNEGTEPTIENYLVSITVINGATFLNVRENSEYGQDYYFYKMVAEGNNKVVLSPVTPNIREKFETSDEMKRFFAANMQNSYFFESTDEVYFRVK